MLASAGEAKTPLASAARTADSGTLLKRRDHQAAFVPPRVFTRTRVGLTIRNTNPESYECGGQSTERRVLSWTVAVRAVT
jgi:hypothetical protein